MFFGQEADEAQLDDEISSHYLSWALDNGFEYIQIDKSNLRDSKYITLLYLSCS